MIEVTPEQMFGTAGAIILIALVAFIAYTLWNFFT